MPTGWSQPALGQGHVIGIVGDPGMGKSRLLAEFRRSLAGQTVTYYAGQCLPDGPMTPYLPVRDVVRQHCGLRATDPPEAVMASIRHCVQEAGLRPEEAAPVLLQLLDIPVQDAAFTQLSPQERKARTFHILHQLSWSASQRQPLVLAVEDVHWIDATSEAWLATLVERLAGTPILVLVTYRTGYRPSWLGQSNATQMALPSLTPHDSLLLVQSVLQTVTVPEAVGHEIVTKAAGNPFFLEELTWSVRMSGSTHLYCTLPTTIQAVLAARLDRLPQAEKALVQTAAVIGLEMPMPLLQAVADVTQDTLPHLLERLQRAEVLYETHLVPVPVYTLKHVLTQEVAYGSLLQERRRALHAQIVEVIETLVGERVAEVASGAKGLPAGRQDPDQVERLAHHALQGEVWDKAVIYCQQAGARAFDRSAFREAVAAFEQALAALQHLPDSEATRAQAIDLRFDLRHALHPLRESGRSIEYLRQAESLAEALGDSRRLGQVAGLIAASLWQLGDLHGSLAAAQRALTIATALGDINLQVAANTSLGQSYWALSKHRHAVEVFSRNIELLHGAALQERFGLAAIPVVTSHAFLTWCHAELGEFAEGRAHGEDAMQLGEMVAHPFSLAFVYATVGHLWLRQGVLPQAIRVLERGSTLAEARNLPLMNQVCKAQLGAAYALCGRIPEALPLLEQALEQSVSVGAPLASALYAVWLGEGYVLAGRVAEAMPLGQRALETSQTQKQQGHQAYALRLLGDIAGDGASPDIEMAQTSYRQARALAEDLDMRPLQAHCHLGLGTLSATTGRREQARAALSAAITLYGAMGMTFWLPQAKAALAQVE